MPAKFDLTTHLDGQPDEVWAQVKRPALFLHVAAPLVRFYPIGEDRFPAEWKEQEYRGAMRLFGLLPIGWQAIVIEYPTNGSGTKFLRDRGHSPILRQWDHRIEVTSANGGTRYTDRVALDAGILTPVATFFVRLFFKHRQRRLKALASSGFAEITR